MTRWEPLPSRIAPESDALHIFRARLDASPGVIDRLREWLADEERARADRFVRPLHGGRFTVTRGVLRGLLGRYLQANPREVRFDYTKLRKPLLDPNPSDLRFNVSHSAELAVYAFVQSRDVGIDVEEIDDRTDRQKLARRFFAPEEARQLLAMLPEEQRAAFFACWTRKEAYIKARGDGLTLPLDSFRVAFAPGEAPALVWSRQGETETGRWTIHSFDTGDGFAAAVCVEGSAGKVSYWNVDPLRLLV